MQLSSILFLAIQAAGVLSAPSAGNEGDAPDLANSSLPPPGTLWERYSDQKVRETHLQICHPQSILHLTI